MRSGPQRVRAGGLRPSILCVMSPTIPDETRIPTPRARYGPRREGARARSREGPGSSARAVLWFGAYTALALAPLIVAALVDPLLVRRPFLIELGVAWGFLAFALIVVECVLVARLHSVSAPFGTDVLMLFHRYMGIAALAFLVAHAALLWPHDLASLRTNRALQCGVIASGAAAVVVASSVHRGRLRLGYESWLRLHRLLVLAVAGAMLGHVLAVDRYSHATGVRVATVGYVALLVAVLVGCRLARPALLQRRPWEVVDNRAEEGDTRTLVVRPVGHPGIAFEPGQFAWLITGRSPFVIEQHPMTISSSSELGPDRSISFSVKALGDWSRSVVPDLAPGARVFVDGPFGAFTIDRAPAQGFVLVAGGIGITPMRSILLSMRDRGDPRPVLLVYAARNRRRAPFLDELRALEGELDLRVVLVFEEPEPGSECGFVTRDLLARHLPERHALMQFFLCGPGPMLDVVERALGELGVPADRVHTERFDLV